MKAPNKKSLLKLYFWGAVLFSFKLIVDLLKILGVLHTSIAGAEMPAYLRISSVLPAVVVLAVILISSTYRMHAKQYMKNPESWFALSLLAWMTIYGMVPRVTLNIITILDSVTAIVGWITVARLAHENS